MADRAIRAAEDLQFSSFHMDVVLAKEEWETFNYSANSPSMPLWRMKL